MARCTSFSSDGRRWTSSTITQVPRLWRRISWPNRRGSRKYVWYTPSSSKIDPRGLRTQLGVTEVSDDTLKLYLNQFGGDARPDFNLLPDMY
jgi:hypothetical protein